MREAPSSSSGPYPQPTLRQLAKSLVRLWDLTVPSLGVKLKVGGWACELHAAPGLGILNTDRFFCCQFPLNMVISYVKPDMSGET